MARPVFTSAARAALLALQCAGSKPAGAWGSGWAGLALAASLGLASPGAGAMGPVAAGQAGEVPRAQAGDKPAPASASASAVPVPEVSHGHGAHPAMLPLGLAAIMQALSLPPEQATRAVIAALPQLQIAQSGVALAQARAQRLQAGVHEWALKLGAQQRSEASTGERFVESDVALERGVRWGQKSQTDRALGSLGSSAGQLAYADTWHETVRGLVQDWFEAQRARAAVQVLAQQTVLAQDQLRVVQRRVRAGESARIDEMMAQAELARAQSAQQQAQGRLSQLVQTLRVQYPGLALGELGAELAADLSLPRAATPPLSGVASTMLPQAWPPLRGPDPATLALWETLEPGPPPSPPSGLAPDLSSGPHAMPNTVPDAAPHAAGQAATQAEAIWLARIVDDNHEVELAQAEAELAQLAAQRAQLDTRADPLLGVRAARERGGSEQVLGVYLTLPLSGALRQADARAALAQADAARHKLALVRQRVQSAAQRALMQVKQTRGVWLRQQSVQQAMAQVAQLSARAYALGEGSLTEALQTRRNALEASLLAQSARWDALEALARLLVDAHQLWPADEH